MKEIYLNKKSYKYFSLLLVMFLSLLMLSTPKVYGIGSEGFAHYDDAPHRAIVTKRQSNQIYMTLTSGPGAYTEFDSPEIGDIIFFDNNHNNPSKYVELDAVEVWGIGDELEYDPVTKQFTLYIPKWDDYKHANYIGEVISIFEDNKDGFIRKAIIHIHNIDLNFEFPLEELPPALKIGDNLIWSSDDQVWNYTDKQPVFSGETAFVTTIDNPISIEEILDRIEVWDDEDGWLQSNNFLLLESDLGFMFFVLEELDEEEKDTLLDTMFPDAANMDYIMDYINNFFTKYTIDDVYSYIPDAEETFYYPETLGSYVTLFVAFDSSNNYTFLTVHVLVKDVTAPVITGKASYSQSYKNKLDINVIQNNLSVHDNYDDNLEIFIKENNYTPNYNKVGTHTIIFRAVDSSKNEVLFTVSVKVIDDVAPVFTGPKSFVKKGSEILLVADILKDIRVNDEVDPSVKYNVITDTFTGFGNRAGRYKIVLEATDKAGNSATHTITIDVSNDIPPVYFVDNFFIYVENIHKLTRQDIIDLLVATNQIEFNATTNVVYILNEYEGNETEPGIYGVMIETKSTSGTSKQISLAIEVTSKEDDDGIIVQPDKTFFEKVWDGIKTVWNWLFKPINDESKFRNVYYFLIVGGALFIFGGIGKFFSKKPYKKFYKKRRRY